MSAIAKPAAEQRMPPVNGENQRPLSTDRPQELRDESRFTPKPPRYDKVFEEGLEWLNSL